MKRILLLTLLSLLLFISGFVFGKHETLNSSSISIESHSVIASKKSSKEKKKLYIVREKRWLSNAEVNELLQASSKEESVIFFSTPTAIFFSASAPGMDYRHHIVHSYLEGYEPFKTSNIWVPWKTLASRKRYENDYHPSKQARPEVWQTSRQAYKYPYGDCEDHSIALADWLISMGKDARVVIGRYGNTGHAWVVLLHGGKQYLLESTRKQGITNLKHLPLAILQEGYYPQYMFNRTTFWKNSGSFTTSSYKDSNWVQMSKFNR